MSERMKIIGEREIQKKKPRQKRARGTKAIYSERVRAKWFCCSFNKLGFVQLICKASLNFQVEFGVGFTNYFKRKTIIRVKACCGRGDVFKDYLCYKTITPQNVSSEAQIKSYFMM